MENSITCTACGEELVLTDALTNHIRADIEKEQKAMLELKEKEFAMKADQLEKEKKLLIEKEMQAEELLKKKLDEEKIKMWALAQEKAKEKVEADVHGKIKELEEMAKEKEVKLSMMQQQEMELRKEKRMLEQKAKEAEVEIMRKVDEEKKKMQVQLEEEAKLREEITRKNIEEEMQKKMMEKDQQVLQMKKTIDELKRKSEQGSMQLQGDAQEESLKKALLSAFPEDRVDDVATGIRGADLIQVVLGATHQPCGVIMWESKNTKAWNKEWIKKLKDDAAEMGADVCCLATTVLPEGISLFGQYEGVWVVDVGSVLPVAGLLRQTLIDIARSKKSLEGRDDKMRMLYEYLSGNQFKGRVENIVSSFSAMKEDLDAEKRAFQKHWARREKQIERVITNTTGMYGDLEGLMGTQLPSIDYFALDFGGEE